MRIRGFALTAVAAMAIGWVGRSVCSDDAPKPAAGNDWVTFGQPGEEHARLKGLVGEWTVAGEMSGAGGAMKMESTSSIGMILGDRYLRQEVRGSVMGMPFEGRGIIGFDNGTKKWFSMWIDSNGTGLLVSDGVENEKGKCWTFKGSFQGPAGPVESRDTITITGENEFTWVSHMGGSEKPTMSLKATRKK